MHTVRRNVIWGNPEALYEDILHYEPANVRALSNLAGVFTDQGNRAKAKEYYEKKIKEGKSKKQALVCVMKRIACIVYGMLKSGEEYRG